MKAALAPLLSYIDPTGGLPPSSWGILLTMVLAGLGGALAVLRLVSQRLYTLVRGYRRGLPILAIILGAGGIMSFWWFGRAKPAPEARTGNARILVLALDGLDPQLLEKYMDEGRLPHFTSLAREGLYHPLRTSVVPQSPVAWSTFITGEDPARHGVFDFLCRDPATYRPDLALADRMRLSLPWQGTPFWERPTLARLGVVAQRLPMVFPPPKLNGRILAGMGVWDVRGTEGTYFYFSTRPCQRPDARGLLLPLRRTGSVLQGELPGPYRAGQPDTVREPFQIELHGPAAQLRLQGKTYPLVPDRWSDWVTVEFGMGLMGLQRVPAITRTLLKITGDQVSLYVSPLNFDPRAPLYPISQPARYAAELVDAIGLYATRGMPFDTQAVTDGVLADEDFLEQVRSVTEESERMLVHELTRFEGGLLFAYFEAGDVVQHLFWRGIDPQHPLHEEPETRRHADAIPRVYEQFDALLGRARTALGAGGAVVVLSDHGFGPFRRSVHLNALLRNLGYLAVKDGMTVSAELFRNIDWRSTRAYALGFNAVYLNLKGREGQGIVSSDEAEAEARTIARKLEQWQDHDRNEKPVKRVRVQLPASASHRTMPDLIVGYGRGYRASWETALGGVPGPTVEPNRKKWSGDHCIDASEVPGIFLSSDRALDAEALAEVGMALEQFLARRISVPAAEAASTD